MDVAVNTHAYAARQKKVALLVDLLVRAKITHADALLATPEEWATAAKAVDSRPPSEETIELVLMALKSLETPLPGGVADPFEKVTR